MLNTVLRRWLSQAILKFLNNKFSPLVNLPNKHRTSDPIEYMSVQFYNCAGNQTGNESGRGCSGYCTLPAKKSCHLCCSLQ